MHGMKNIFNHKSGTLFLFLLFLLLLNWPLVTIYFDISLMFSLIYIFTVMLLITICTFVGMKRI